MAQAPGGLTELDQAGAKAWDAKLAEAVSGTEIPPQVLVPADERTPEVTGPDWPAYPNRVESCLGRERAHQLLDWRTSDGDEGRFRHQEEYLEWRVDRDERGRPRRIEMTTEFAAYWQVLASHQPAEAIARVSEFAQETVQPKAIYSDLDPFGKDATPERRAQAFSQTMLREDTSDLAGLSPYNSGLKAICCMIQPTNTLGALINLVAAAAEPHVVTDAVSHEARFMSGSEAIEVIRRGAAQDCRNSDPVVVERVVRLASEGRLIALDDPIGVYIQGVEHGQLLQPDGSPVPIDWFTFGRGLAADRAPDGRPRHQRLTLAVPPDEGFGLSDLTQSFTGKPITGGAQVAELVKLGVHIRTSAQDVVDVELKPELIPAVIPCSEQPDCQEMIASWQQFEKAQ